MYHVHIFVINLQQSVECEVYDDDEDLATADRWGLPVGRLHLVTPRAWSAIND